MRAAPTSLVGLALFFGLANAQNAYDNTCQSPPSGEQEIKPGVMVTYGCGSIHDSNDYDNIQKTTATPEDCVSECAKRSPEGPCSWHSGICYFYKAGANAAAWPSAVTVTIRKDWDKLNAAYEQCQTDKTTIDGQLTACQASNTGPPNTGPPNTGPPNTAPPNTGPPVRTRICPGDGSIVTAPNGKKYEAYCSQGMRQVRGIGNPVNLNSLQECVERCSVTSSCVASFYTHAGSCIIYSSGTPTPGVHNQNGDLYFGVP